MSYSVRFHWAHRTSGHLFQGRFKAVLVQDSPKVAEVDVDPLPHTQPEKDQKGLLTQMGWQLPQQEPPKITAKRALENGDRP